MAHENLGMRLSGDVYLQRLGATEQPVIGPLPAEVFGVQSNAKLTDVRDTRRGRRGQRLRAVPDPEPPTGSLVLLSVPPKVLALIAMGTEIAVAIAGGTVSGEAHAYWADYGIQLGQRNVGSVVLTPGIAATLATGVVVSNNALTWTAVTRGPSGNAVTVALVDPAAANVTLAVSVVGSAITVRLATSGASAITSTAAQVRTAVAASAAASALVGVANTSTSTGAAVVVAAAATALAGGTAGGTAFTAGTDYQVLDAPEGLVRPVTGGAMGATGLCFAAYSYGAISGAGIVWGTDSVVRVAIKLCATNDAAAAGDAVRWAAASVLLTPDGEIDFGATEPIKAKFKLAPETLAGAAGPAELTWPVLALPS